MDAENDRAGGNVLLRWFSRLPNSVAGAISCLLVFGLLPCNSVPAIAGFVFGWPWGVGAFVVLWGAFGVYQILPSTQRIDPRYLARHNETKETDDDVS